MRLIIPVIIGVAILAMILAGCVSTCSPNPNAICNIPNDDLIKKLSKPIVNSPTGN